MKRSWNLYILLPRNPDTGPWSECWDTAHGFIIQARDSREARATASFSAGYEGSDVWVDPDLTSCKQLRPTGNKPRVIMRDYFPG